MPDAKKYIWAFLAILVNAFPFPLELCLLIASPSLSTLGLVGLRNQAPFRGGRVAEQVADIIGCQQKAKTLPVFQPRSPTHAQRPGPKITQLNRGNLGA